MRYSYEQLFRIGVKMTVEIKDTFTIKTKRKEHPNAGKYPGRPSMEFGSSINKFLSKIGISNSDAFERGEFIYEENTTAEFFDSILPGDVVGLGLLKGFNEYGMNEYCKPCAYKFKILSVDKEKDIIQARNVTFEHPKNKDYVGTEVQITFEEVSYALGMGFGEILERGGKPFGVSEEIELKVKVFGDKKEESEKVEEVNNVVLPEETKENSNMSTTSPKHNEDRTSTSTKPKSKSKPKSKRKSKEK